jgi:hypothetical protein
MGIDSKTCGSHTSTNLEERAVRSDWTGYHCINRFRTFASPLRERNSICGRSDPQVVEPTDGNRLKNLQ